EQVHRSQPEGQGSVPFSAVVDPADIAVELMVDQLGLEAGQERQRPGYSRISIAQPVRGRGEEQVRPSVECVQGGERCLERGAAAVAAEFLVSGGHGKAGKAEAELRVPVFRL